MEQTIVVVPQAVELRPLVRGFQALGHEVRRASVGRLTCTFVDDLGLVLAVGGHGKAELAVHTQHLIERSPDAGAVICAGAAGALADDLARGDVVVGTSCVEHDFKRRFSGSPCPCHYGHAPGVARFRAAVADLGTEFRVHFGAIASGDEDVVDRERARQLREETGAVCVAWEGAGGARAALFNSLPFVEVRAITDGADETAAADFRTSLETAMPNLARVLARWAKA